MGNPNHDPKNGEFTFGPGGVSTGDHTTDHALNYRNSGGSFNKQVRVLSTYTVHQRGQKFVVTDDLNNNKIVGGFKTAEKAVATFKASDWRRHGFG